MFVLYPKYIDIYEFRGIWGGGVHIPQYNFCLLLKKTKKVQEHDQHYNQTLHHFDFKKNS